MKTLQNNILSGALFRSVRFNVWLFCVIAILSAVGTFIPQVTDNAEKVQQFMANHPTTGQWFDGLGLFDIYHTLFFAGLLGLMAFDVIVCKLANRPPDFGLAPLPKDAEDKYEFTLRAVERKPHRISGQLAEPLPAAHQRIQTLLKNNHFAVREQALPGGGVVLVAARHRMQRWGSYISHISLVVILVGAMAKSLLGFETFLPVLEGRSSSVAKRMLDEMDKHRHPEPARDFKERLHRLLDAPTRMRHAIQSYSIAPIADWYLRVNKMTVDFYPHSTTPSTFASDVLVESDRGLLADTTLRVNAPLDLNGVRFYQSSWGVTGMVRQAKIRVGGKTLTLGSRDRFPIPGHPWIAQVEYYLPDFTVDANGEPGTASLEWKNPALVFGFYNKEDVLLTKLVMGVASPTTPKDAAPWALFFTSDGQHMAVQHSPIEVLSVDPVLFSGVQVSYDPGFKIILGGVLAMLFGLSCLFYLHQRRVTVFLETVGEGTRIEVGAWSSQRVADYAPAFKRLFAPLPLN